MNIKRPENTAAAGCMREGYDDLPGGELIRGWAGICAEVHKSRVQLWRDIRAGRFPAPIETGANSISWFRSEVEAWKASRPRRTYSAVPQADQAA